MRANQKISEKNDSQKWQKIKPKGTILFEKSHEGQPKDIKTTIHKKRQKSAHT